MATNLSTKNYRLENANRLINDIATSNNYYFFYGFDPTASNTSPQPLYDIVSNNYTQAWNNMVGGKQISSNNVYNVINNVQWIANTVYAMYDDQDSNLPNEQFFVITTEGSFNHVWKCLNNNFGVPSQNQPFFIHASTTPFYQTADGYQWKYMTTIASYIGELYNTSNYFPIVANTTVQNEAVPGAINVFKVTGNGALYNNWVLGTFIASDIAVNGSPVQYNISNNQASLVNGYYTGCLLYVTGGSGAGQYATVTGYNSNSTGNILTLSNPLFPAPQNGSTYEVYPQIALTGENNQLVNCIAFAVVNALASNSIGYVSVLQPGQGYTSVANSYVVANSVVGITNGAIIRAIMSPQGGHGANVFVELYSNSVGMTVTLSNSENSTILTQAGYTQIGVLNSPQFTNVNLQFASTTGNFILENVYTFTASQLNPNVSMNLNSTTISSPQANMLNQVVVGENICLIGGPTQYQLTQVNSIANASTITIASPALFTSNTAVMYAANITGSAAVTNVNSTNSIMVTNCTGISFQTGANVIGGTSGIQGILQSVVRNGTTEFFNTFIELYKYNATTTSGTFEDGEQVQQGSNTAYLYAFTGTSSLVLYLYDFVGGVFGSGPVVGLSSGAQATISGGYNPDLVPGAGNILYLENISEVTRANTQSEQFNLVFNF